MFTEQTKNNTQFSKVILREKKCRIETFMNACHMKELRLETAGYPHGR